MAQIFVDAASLRTKSEELAQLNEQFRAQVIEMQNNEQALSGMWEGDSKQTFHNAFASDATQMNNFYNAIAQFIARLQNIIALYEQAEAQNTQIASARNY